MFQLEMNESFENIENPTVFDSLPSVSLAIAAP